MQARITGLSILVQRLEAQLAAERRMRVRQQQQTVATVRRLERLHSAVNVAAAAGDPTAKAVWADNMQAVPAQRRKKAPSLQRRRRPRAMNRACASAAS
jgi:hypothetical protein